MKKLWPFVFALLLYVIAFYIIAITYRTPPVQAVNTSNQTPAEEIDLGEINPANDRESVSDDSR